MKIAFYLNLQGAGHCRRFEAIARHLPKSCQIAAIGMNGPPNITHLNRPVECISVPGYGLPPTNPFLQQQTSHDYHDFLVNQGGNAAFTMAMVSFLSQWQPDLLVSDVGLEASILGRMCGIPVIYARQHGRRWDKGHQLAYEWACSLWAPFSSEMEQPDCPKWIREKTFYSGGFCRFSKQLLYRKASLTPAISPPNSYAADKPNVLVMTGFGGTAITAQKLSTAAAMMSQWRWHLLGENIMAEGVVCHGVVEDVWPYLYHADLVVANAGHNSVMETIAAEAPAVFIPAERPFDEQICKAEVLRNLGLGVISQEWPEVDEWEGLWMRSHAQDRSQWRRFQDADAPRRAAEHIIAIARKCIEPQSVKQVASVP